MAQRKMRAPRSECFSGYGRFRSPGRARGKLAEIEVTDAQAAVSGPTRPRSWYRCAHCGWIHLSPVAPSDDTLEAPKR